MYSQLSSRRAGCLPLTNKRHVHSVPRATAVGRRGLPQPHHRKRLVGLAALVASNPAGVHLVLKGKSRDARALLHRRRRPCRCVRQAELGKLDLVESRPGCLAHASGGGGRGGKGGLKRAAEIVLDATERARRDGALPRASAMRVRRRRIRVSRVRARSSGQLARPDSRLTVRCSHPP